MHIAQIFNKTVSVIFFKHKQHSPFGASESGAVGKQHRTALKFFINEHYIFLFSIWLNFILGRRKISLYKLAQGLCQDALNRFSFMKYHSWFALNSFWHSIICSYRFVFWLWPRLSHTQMWLMNPCRIFYLCVLCLLPVNLGFFFFGLLFVCHHLQWNQYKTADNATK